MVYEVVHNANDGAMPPIITTAELAALLRVNTSTVRRWVSHGVITPAITTPGGHYRFDEASALQEIAAAK